MLTLVQKTFILATWAVQFVTIIGTNAVCPSKFPGGVWDNCQNRENETCTYSCLSGFHKNPKIQNATCLPVGAWNQNTENLCRHLVKDNFILFADSKHDVIFQMSLTDQSIQPIMYQATRFLSGVTYSPFHDLLIWSSDESDLFVMHLNGTGKTTLEIPFAEPRVVLYHRFAVDYSTGNIYYIPNYYVSFYNGSSSIHVMSLDGKHRYIVTGLNNAHGLVVYPSKGLLFYTESDETSHIGQASMDGSQSKVILDLGMTWPTDLAIDYISDYLYWINDVNGIISFCKLDGTNYRKLTELTGYYRVRLHGLALYQDYLFTSSEQHSQVIKLKISNPNETTVLANVPNRYEIRDISVYSSTVQNRNAFCSSGNGGCSTFCFPTPNGGICGCEDGVDLKKGSDKECSNSIDGSNESNRTHTDSLYTEEEWKQYEEEFNSADTNRDGHIDREEFRAARLGGILETAVDEVFDTLDANRDGLLTFQDIKNLHEPEVK